MLQGAHDRPKVQIQLCIQRKNVTEQQHQGSAQENHSTGIN